MKKARGSMVCLFCWICPECGRQGVALLGPVPAWEDIEVCCLCGWCGELEQEHR